MTRRAILFQRPVMLRRTAPANVAYALAQAGVPHRERAGRIAVAARSRRACRTWRSGRRGAYPAANSSGWRWPVRWRAIRKFFCSTSPPPISIPAATRGVEEIVLSAARSGVKIVMASHDLGQVRRLAGDVIFLVRGALCEQGGAKDFLDRPTTPEAAAFLRGDLVI